MEALRRISPIKKPNKGKKKKGPAREGDAAEDHGGHMSSVVMALLSKAAGDDMQAVKHLNESRMKEDESEVDLHAKATIHDKLAGPARGEIALARATDFIFDGQIQKSASLEGGMTLPRKPTGGELMDINPSRQFAGKHDTLIGAFFARDASESVNDIFDESDLQFKSKKLDINYANEPRVDGTINGIPILHDVSEAAKHSKHYRWTNKIANTTALPQKKPGKSYVLVEESKLEQLSRFESSLSEEARLIASKNYGDNVEGLVEPSTNSDGDGESKNPLPEGEDTRVGQQLATNILNHSMIDPRVPTDTVVKALKKLNGRQMKQLVAQWDELQRGWVNHAKENNYQDRENSDRAFIFRTYTEEKIMSMTHDKDSRTDWLLRNCPVPQRAKKLRLAKEAFEAYCKRRDRDTMLYEDDRSFLHQQIYDCNMRTVDYERYVFLCGLFGPMSVEDWANSGSQPGTKYWVRATVAVTKIQHAWDRYWSTYKLHRYRAARDIQKAYRCHWGWKNLHPIVLIRQKIGKRTYYFFCWAAWTDYNRRVKRIAYLLHFHRYNWPHQCWDAWVKYIEVTTKEKKATLSEFRRKFDTRMFCLHRWQKYRDRSLRLKCMLRNMYYIPQFQMWVQAVQAIKRERELGYVVTPVQAWFRMRSQWMYFQKLQEKKWVFLRLGHMLRGRAKVTRTRNKHISDTMETWGPDELERRRLENLEIERRRQIREHQLAEEKALTSVRELQKHFKSWQGKVQVREEAAGTGVKKDKAAYELLKRCYLINYEQTKHEYRIKKGPHVVCADPLCHKIFASDDAYVEHIEEMMEGVDVSGGGGDRSKVPKGVLKEDVYKRMAVEALLEVVSYVDEEKAAEVREAAKKAKAARSARMRANQQIAPEEQEGNPDSTGSVLGHKKDLTAMKPKKSAAEKYADKKKKEAEKLAREEQRKEVERRKEEQEKKDKKKAKRARAKDRRRASVVGLPGVEGLAGAESKDGDDEENEKGGEEGKDKEGTETGGDSKGKGGADAVDDAATITAVTSLEDGTATGTEDPSTSDAATASVTSAGERAGVSGGGDGDVDSSARGVTEDDIEKEIQHEGIRRHMVFPSSNFARFHILLRHPRGLAAVRHYLGRKHGVCPLLNTLDCWDAIQMWRLGSVASSNEPFIVRALSIYDNHLAPNCSRPLEIVLADGNILSNAYHRAHKQHGRGGIRELFHFDHHEQETEHWWEDLVRQLLQVRDREFVGFYGNARARPSYLRRGLGLRGQPYLCWSDKRTLHPDIFDALEWACFQTIYRNVYYFDALSTVDQVKNAEIERMQRKVEAVREEERRKKAEEEKRRADATVARMAHEKEYLAQLRFKKRRHAWLDAHEWDLEGWADLVAREKVDAKEKAEKEKEEATRQAILDKETKADEEARARVEAAEATAKGKGKAGEAEGNDNDNDSPPSAPGSGAGAGAGPPSAPEDAVAKRKREGRHFDDSYSGLPFYASREYSEYVEAKELEKKRQREALVADYCTDRKKRIAEWSKVHKAEEMDISALAQRVVVVNWEKEVQRLAEKAAKVWATERVCDYAEIEQKPVEYTQALADDAVGWVEDKELDHMFDHYGTALLEEMLTHEEMVEGMMEYAGFLKGQKQLKKHLKIEMKAVGVREDLTWLKECLKAAIAEDMQHLPLDYMGCVRLVQRRVRGWLGRTKARRKFATTYLKKYDPNTGDVYYVNGMRDPPEVSFEKPRFMHHLFPANKW